MFFQQILAGEMQNFVYLIGDEASREGADTLDGGRSGADVGRS